MMKITKNFLSSGNTARQKGQTFIPIMVFIGMFLLALLGVAVDYSQLWAHRQITQAAADAACQAGSADIFLNATSPSLSGTGGLGSFSWIGGSAFNCTASSTLPPCQYAALNGFGGANASNVNVSFPTSVDGVDLSAFNLPSTTATFIKVTITDNVPMTLSRLALNNPSVAVKASATCGVAAFLQPVPMVILHPTAASALSTNGNQATITILGGPQRSIQVNSSDTGAVDSNVNVDLRKGGPASPPTGSDFADLGGPSSKPGGILLGITGKYIVHAAPIADPFAAIGEPPIPGANGTARAVPFALNGCPDPAGCVEFTPGKYTACSNGNLNPGDNGCLQFPYGGSNPKFASVADAWTKGGSYLSGQLVLPRQPVCNNNGGGYIFKVTTGGTADTNCPAWPQVIGQSITGGGGVVYLNVGTASTTPNTALFDPGLCYLCATGLGLGQNSTVRMSTAAGDGSIGVMFFFSSTGTISVDANSGKFSACTSVNPQAGTSSPSNCIVSYNINGTTSSVATGSVTSLALQCPNGGANPTIPGVNDAGNDGSVNGNILLGPCGKVTGDPGISKTYGSNDGNRGFLLFQTRSQATNAAWGGHGQFLSSGFFYFHHAGSGTTCGSNTSCLTLQGGSGTAAYTLGNVVVDKLLMGGNPNINMILNPTSKFEVLKPTLLQ